MLVLKLVCNETVVVTVSRPTPNTLIFITVASPRLSAYSHSIVQTFLFQTWCPHMYIEYYRPAGGREGGLVLP